MVERLEALGPGHPLVARLEAQGWEGLREDLEARQRLARADARPAPPWYAQLPVGVVARCPVCDGAGHSPDGEYECPECKGLGVLRPDWELGWELEDAPVPAGWGQVYRALRSALQDRKHAEKGTWRVFLDDPELPFWEGGVGMKKREFEALAADVVADGLAQLANLVRELVPYGPVRPEAKHATISERYGAKEEAVEVRWYKDVVQIVLRWADDAQGMVIGVVRCDANDLDAAARAAARETVKAIEGMPEPVAAVLRALDRAKIVAADQLIRAEEAWEVHQARAAWAMREIMARRAPRWPTGVEEEVE